MLAANRGNVPVMRASWTGSLISEDDKERFLNLYRAGHKRHEAAKALDGDLTGTMFRRLCNPRAATYDPVFARAYEDAYEDHKAAYSERLEDMLISAAEKGDTRAIITALAASHPDYAHLRSKGMKVEVTVEYLQAILPMISTETLEQMASEYRSRKLEQGGGELKALTA